MLEGSLPQRSLAWIDFQGREELIAADPGDYASPRISPDGSKVALNLRTETTSDIWIWDLLRESIDRLTINENSSFPLWTLDGQRIAFYLNSTDAPGVYWRAADGTGEDELFGSAAGETIVPYSWASDGKILIAFKAHLDSRSLSRLMRPQMLRTLFDVPDSGLSQVPVLEGIDVGSLSPEDGQEWNPLLDEEYFEIQPKVSPDERWIVYTSTESGEPEIYARPFPDVDKGRKLVSTDGGFSPLWSPDGRKVFYRSFNGIMAIGVETDPTFTPGKPEVLFQNANISDWDIHPTEKLFLIIKSVQAADDESSMDIPRKINIVLNWFEELKDRVPLP